MDTKTLLEKITALPLVTAELAEGLMAGDLRSIFKGQGMEFNEVRHYLAGDDIRSIDWNASARFGTPYVKMYREERELTVMILLDISASMHGGSFIRRHTARNAPGGVSHGKETESLTPYEQGLIATALIALSAERTGQRVGACFFDRGIHRVFPPRKGRRHAMALISRSLQYQNKSLLQKTTEQSSNISAAITAAARMLKRRSLVVLISDFFSLGWEQHIGDLNSKHDVIALRISDFMEKDLLDIGLVSIEDPETRLRIEAPTNRYSFREEWLQWHAERCELWAGQCRRYGVEYLELSTSDDAPAVLLKFFGRRQTRERS